MDQNLQKQTFSVASLPINYVILVLKMLVYSEDFYFSFFHYFASPNSSVTAAYVASRSLHELKLFNSASKTLAHPICCLGVQKS